MMDNTQIERIAINKVSLFFTEQFNWIVREEAILDYGIDMQIEIKDNNIATGVLIALQVKGGDSHCKKDKNGDFIYRGKLRHLEYWNNHSLPVLFIWHNESDKNLYWQRVSLKSPNINKSEKGWSLKIPSDNILTCDSKETIINECFNSNEYQIIQENNISILRAKRYTLKIIIHQNKKFIIKRIIRKIHDDYIGSHNNLNTLTIFYYRNISQIDNGFYFCRTQWNNQKFDYRLNTISPNDKINDIDIEWNDESDFFNDYLIDNNKYISKFEYIEICDKSISLSEKFIKSIIDIKDFKKIENIIFSFESQIDNEVNSILNESFKISIDMKPLKKIRASSINWLQNIQIIFNDKNRNIGNKLNVLKIYIDNIKKDIEEYKQYKKILER